jgi:hypothetical protein
MANALRLVGELCATKSNRRFDHGTRGSAMIISTYARDCISERENPQAEVTGSLPTSGKIGWFRRFPNPMTDCPDGPARDPRARPPRSTPDSIPEPPS